ncbi:MAG TPA: cytochrome P450 [Caulobacteraceae bacterium]|nr:cytochrome P450 [Caulobacteraceae bacterium]
MADGSARVADEARERAYSTPLEDYHPGDPELFRTNTHWPWFERLRAEEPVHWCRESEFGPYWSVTKYADIMTVDTNHGVFSSESALGGITIRDTNPDLRRPSFIAMDPPKHDAQRKTVSPVVSPANLANLEPIIRERAAKILDELPIGETFDWVDKVSIELTTQMLATLFDFPFEERRKLTYWSDVATVFPAPGQLVESEEEKNEVLLGCLDTFLGLWAEREKLPPRGDLISMMAHGDATKDMDKRMFLGNLVLLIVGGNDTTRNSISGGLLALNENPDQYDKLRADHGLITSMVPEIIRWQTPLAHMRRTATADMQIGDKTIKAGDKVVMWYVSGNRDEEAIENPNAFIIDRERPRQHLSFGFGIHRCVGNRLAEMQLKVVWEEILKRFERIEVMAEPVRVRSSFIKGYESMPVRIAA